MEIINRAVANNIEPGSQQAFGGRVPASIPGGSKGFEADVYMGAFNYLDYQGFLADVRGAYIEDDDMLDLSSVQIFVKGDDDDEFRVESSFSFDDEEED